MIPIGQAYYHADIDLSVERRAALTDDLHAVARTAVAEFLPFGEVEIEVLVEEGSLRTRVILGALAGTLLFYGELRQSVEYLVRDARTTTGWINRQVQVRTGSTDYEEIRVMRRTMVPGRLLHLFEEVEAGDRTAVAAYAEATRLLLQYEEPEAVAALLPSVADALGGGGGGGGGVSVSARHPEFAARRTHSVVLPLYEERESRPHEWILDIGRPWPEEKDMPADIKGFAIRSRLGTEELQRVLYMGTPFRLLGE